MPSPQVQPDNAPAAPSGTPAIDVRGLECGYEGKVVLQNLTFTVGQAELFFVIGGSGCGKSTLLRHLIGLNRPTAGEVRFFGQVFGDQGEKQRRELLKTFGVLFQSGALWSSLTLRENVALPLELHTALSRREREELATLKLSQVGLQGFEDYYPAEISGGMKKRAGLARALALDPAIVFFDEPSAGLDPITSRKLDELILNVRDTFGTTCVVVSHELASIMGIGDRVILLSREAKGIVAEGDPRLLARDSEHPLVREFFSSGGIRHAAPATPST
jgi:phospholipid/cholesterol/gamma-HCH transport system ATP-binding protein